MKFFLTSKEFRREWPKTFDMVVYRHKQIRLTQLPILKMVKNRLIKFWKQMELQSGLFDLELIFL